MIPWTEITADIRLIVESADKRYKIVRVTDIFGRKIYRVLHNKCDEDYNSVYNAGSIEKCLEWLRKHDVSIICNI